MSKGTTLLARTSHALFNRIAPTGFAESWDNVGLLIEAPLPRATASKVFLTIDLTLETVNEAIKDPSVGVIVAYHPPIFSGLKRLTVADTKQHITLLCVAHGISVLSPHTSLDTCSGGINDWLARGLASHYTSKPIIELDAKRKEIAQSVNQLEEAGTGRFITLAEPLTVEELVKRIKKHLKLSHLRLALPGGSSAAETLIRTVAICAGSGNSVVTKSKGADLYFTGEMGHHEVLEATAKGITVVLCEHTNTERGYLGEVLQNKLETLINADGGSHVQVVSSALDVDPLVIV
ncbi:GTP cyclohydrolase 1 type 2/Nif3 [Obelidium mucronatum]|nr:GTP cyclohydrolase 1 type 2/Nif3 [Obelidium mucronatum]